ncbi:MAG: DUF5908 family protein [Actinomycetota bacterium]|nr:DUF5908 family protein [Actinomycetota bacterium]
MPVTIREITSEVVVGGADAPEEPVAGTGGESSRLVERVVREATERVLERLRLEREA